MVDHHFPRDRAEPPIPPRPTKFAHDCAISPHFENFGDFLNASLWYGKTLFAKRCRCPLLVAQHVLTRKGSFFVCESPSPILSTQPHRSWFILKCWQWCRKTCFLIGCLPPYVLSSRSKPKKRSAQRWAPVGTGRQACSIPASCEGSLAFSQVDHPLARWHMGWIGFEQALYIWYIYIWVNYNDLTVLPKPGILVDKGNHPKMAELFRLVNYYNFPGYIHISWPFYKG